MQISHVTNGRQIDSEENSNSIIIIMALQPFVGPWPPFFSFLILYTVGRTPWTGDQPVVRPLPIHRTSQTQNKHTQYRHPCL
jgi:hypothetical protein